jgi:hypothetical protein
VSLLETFCFACRQWSGAGAVVAAILLCGLLTAGANVLMPMAAGRLVDALIAGGSAGASAPMSGNEGFRNAVATTASAMRYPSASSASPCAP